MIEESELLRSYLQGIRHLSGAGSVTLYVPAPLTGFSRPLLIHDGELAPVPELADLDTAQSYAAKVGYLEAEEAAATGLPRLFPSEAADAALIPLPVVHSAWTQGLIAELEHDTGSGPPARREADAGAQAAAEPGGLLGLRFPPGEGTILERLAARHLPAELTRADDPVRWWDWLFAMGGALASHTTQVAAMLRDPVTGLPDRTGFQAILAEELEKSRLRARPLSLLFVNPDDFGAVNQRLGREEGDAIVREIGSRLRSTLRRSDPVARYGGVIFAATLGDTPLRYARAVAEKVLRRLREEQYHDGSVRLGFSLGLAVFEPDDETITHPLDLVRRADQALNTAKRRGGDRCCDWQEETAAEEAESLDRLSGIFTGNVHKDYRNMVLLWDTIDIVAVNPRFDGLVAQVVEKLYTASKADQVGLFSLEDGRLRLLRGLTRRHGAGGLQNRLETVEPTAWQDELMAAAIAEGDAQTEERQGAEGAGERSCFAVPLITGDDCLGCLLIEGGRRTLDLERSDLVFLKALASQLALALDRARLSEAESRRREQERRQLRAELNELRHALQQAKLVYRSPEMTDLLERTRRVAATDATVLITGDSGTGKEMLARTLHELSRRKERALVVVDCGAIPTTLMDSELFGHEKGAYTGADQRRTGRLVQADGGTVLLDEVGELPLEVQSKLLRFVQEKQFTTVGGTKPQSADVRIVAATNRDLTEEVAAGRFREDLYHRLNVVRLHVPPLRERPDDVLHLARHFFDLFTVQYQKSLRRLSPAAEQALLRHTWPGNVRELQNRMMQAVILCEGDELRAAELGLGDQRDRGAVGAGADSGYAAERAAPAPTAEELWDGLRQALRRQVDLAASERSDPLPPLGTWLTDDLLAAADEACGQVVSRACELLGMPESTYRRRLKKAARAPDGRSASWGEVRQLVGQIVRAAGGSGDSLLDLGERILLEEIVARLPGNTGIGSGLLGVTPPTFRRRLSGLEPTDSA